MTKVIGLTGGIACGKSSVSEYLKDKGFTIVDADQISHEALDDPLVKTAIFAAFDCETDGIVDRGKLGAIVFKNPEKRALLESIMHPYIYQQSVRQINECEDAYVILDAPLLFEAQFDQLCDTIIVVTCTPKVQLTRLMARNHFDEQEARRRINAQMSLAEKEALGDYVINNNGTLDDLYKEVEKVMKEVCG